MINTISIKKKRNYNTLEKKRAIIFSVSTAFFLMLIKIIVGISTGSLSLFASAIDSLSDLFISSSNIYIIQKSDEKPTKKFPYGLGKLEGLAGLFQGLIIIGMGIFLIVHSVIAIMYNTFPSRPWETVWVMCFSIVVTFFLSKFLKYQAKKTNSLALEADAIHYEVDLISNFGILIGFLFLIFTNISILDAIISIIVSVVIILNGGKISKKSVENLLDREVEKDMQEKILSIFKAFQKSKAISGFHFLRTRQSGSKIFIDAHIVFNEKTLLITAHKISHEIEKKLLNNFPNSEILLHFDPFDDSEEDKEEKW